MYQAIVTKIENIYPIEISPGVQANSIQRGWLLGYSVVIGKDTKVGDLGVFFPPDGQLSEEFCDYNNLIARFDESGKKIGGGYFDYKRRVKAQKFKGVKSEGFFVPLSYFNYIPSVHLTENMRFDTLNGVKVCEKYYTPRTLHEKNKKAQKQAKKKAKVLCFAEHMDTEQLRYYIKSIKPGSLLYITHKLHGTSGRTGRVIVERTLPWYKKAVNFLRPGVFPTRGYEYVTGTRRTILVGDADGFYGETFRRVIEKKYFEGNLDKGEIVYYEIVGYTESGASIMEGRHISEAKDSLEKNDIKHLQKLYGERMEYSYGCERLKDEEGKITGGTFDIYVYRITRVNEDGEAVDLSWPQVVYRCNMLGVKSVPEAEPGFFYDGDREKLLERIQQYLDVPSVIDSRHLEEGICLRVEGEYDIKIYKHKSFYFSVLEGLTKDRPDYLDREESE